MDDIQMRARRFILEAMKETNLTASALAKKAGLQPSTLTRFLTATENPNETTVKFTLSARSLQKIARAAGLDMPDLTPGITATGRRSSSALEVADALSDNDYERWLNFGKGLAASTKQSAS